MWRSPKGLKKRNCNGFSLIELIIFIAVTGFIVSGIFTTLQMSLTHSPKSKQADRAIELAQERMDIIIGEKTINGFSSLTDPCTAGSPPAICTTESGYTVSSTITTGFNGNNNLKEIVVTVTGTGTASITALVGDY